MKPVQKPRRPDKRRGTPLEVQGVEDRAAGKPMSAGPKGPNFSRWFEGWTAEDERIRNANQKG